MPFFLNENNVALAYLSFGIFIFISVVILGVYYKEILEKKTLN
jgi:hypothetical protein